MKWTVKLVAEAPLGNLVEQEVGTIEREDSINPATLGLTIAEGKAIVESLQREVVAAQVQRHGASIKCCSRCSKSFRTKGYYQATLRSVYGKGPDAGSTHQGMSLHGISGAQLFDDLHEQVSDHTGVALPHCQNGGLVAVWQSYRVFE